MVGAKKIFAEISEDEKWIDIHFRYDERLVRAMNKANAVFIPSEKSKDGTPYWKIPCDYEEAKLLIEKVGRDSIQIGDAMMEWAKREKIKEENLNKVISLSDMKLEVLPKVLPEMAKLMKDYQRVGSGFGAHVQHYLNADQPGLGKTWEAVGSIFEAGTDKGPTLVIAPLTSVDTVWEYELMRLQPHPVLVACGAGMNRSLREEVLYQAQDALDADMPFWLIVNPKMVQFRREGEEEDEAGRTVTKLVSPYEFLHDVEWANIIIDECHRGALRKHDSVTAKGMYALKTREGGKRIALSGTPMGGKPINLYGILRFLEPVKFSSKWRWAKQWLEIIETGYGAEIGEIRSDRAEAFQRHLAPFVIRRTKEEVLKELPPKQRIDLWAEMTPSQAAQYRSMAKMARLQIEDENISAQSILALYVRLKQFAGSAQELTDGKLTALPDSGKLNLLLDKLDELGIMDGEGEEQAVIFSQFEQQVNMIYKVLTDKGVPTLMITGATNKKGDRSELQRNFQEGKARVMIMTTTAGGLAITLDKANTVFILDETWNPDDQEQAEDRCHRASRIHQVTIYYLRTKDTIEEYIRKITMKKRLTNKVILDEARHIKLYKEEKV